MKKILIVDCLGLLQHPDVLQFSFVKFLPECDCINTIDPSEYEAAFIHDRNEREVQWAKEKLNKVILFSGGFIQFTNVRNENRIYKVRKSIYNAYIIDVLEEYARTGNLNLEKFM
jgi:hypothetical protein